MVFARFGSPNCGLVTNVFTPEYVTRFSTLAASIRQSMLMRSLHRNVREMDASRENVRGPVAEFLPASPHRPGAGGAYATGFR
jgi:hypothetical protein